MKKILKKSKVILAVAGIIAATAVMAAAVPGSDSDPLISKSYIDEVLMPKIESMVSGSGTGQTAFEVVSLKKGKTLLCEDGCELIIRMGRAKVVATAKGGIADVTDGADLANGTDAPANHLLIVPVGDGRGLLALDDMLVMTKGGYEIK